MHGEEALPGHEHITLSGFIASPKLPHKLGVPDSPTSLDSISSSEAGFPIIELPGILNAHL